jgi:Phage integrase family
MKTQVRVSRRRSFEKLRQNVFKKSGRITFFLVDQGPNGDPSGRLRSFFRYASLEVPEHSALIQRVLAIPRKRHIRPLIDFLVRPKIEALLSAPDRHTWIGQRDHAFLLVAVQTGLRLSELTGLRQQDVSIGTGAHVRCLGKGRKKERLLLRSQRLRSWLHGSNNKAKTTLCSCSPAHAGGVSVPTPLNIWSPATWRPHRRCAHLFPKSELRPMYLGTPPRWNYFKPVWIVPSSPSGWATNQ